MGTEGETLGAIIRGESSGNGVTDHLRLLLYSSWEQPWAFLSALLPKELTQEHRQKGREEVGLLPKVTLCQNKVMSKSTNDPKSALWPHLLSAYYAPAFDIHCAVPSLREVRAIISILQRRFREAK